MAQTAPTQFVVRNRNRLTMTGHRVYSTLHTSSASATAAPLLDLDLKPYVVASALEAIIAQRLVPRICNHCREQGMRVLHG
ncbi:MAG: ATPase, T2SS/T4P/T4SS family [Marinobacter sp.]